MHHATYTFLKRLSHTADSQDQRHRMVPASRPLMTLADTVRPDYVTPPLVAANPRALEIYAAAMERAWAAKNRLLDMGVPLEAALYLLPNAKCLRFHESGGLVYLAHKWVMRTCFNAQEEIYRASMDELEQVRAVHPLLARYMGPPCVIRAGPRHPDLHRGRPLLRRPRVAQLPRGRAQDLSRAHCGDAVGLGTRRGARARGALGGPRGPHRGRGPLPRPRPLVRRLVAARRRATPWSRGRRWPTASSPSTRRPACCARRPGFSLRELNRLLPAAGLLHPGHPGHGVRHPRRDGRGRRPRQEPPPRRLPSATTSRRCACGWPTAASSSARARWSPTSSARRSAAWASPATSSRSSAGSSAIPSPWIVTESERIADIDAVHRRAEGGGTDVALHAGLDRLPVARRGAGARDPDARPLRGGGRGAPAAAPAAPAARASPSCSPLGLVGRWSVRAFNALWYHRHVPRVRRGLVSPEWFFYPLDFIAHWNRMYGPRGLHAVPVRGARRRRPRRGAALPRAAHRAAAGRRSCA